MAAIALRPDLAEAYNCLGLALLELGRAREANEALERAIELAPRRPRYYYNLGQSRRFSSDDPHIAMMTALARERACLAEDEWIDLCFALGKALADIESPEQSLPLLLEGNALRRRRLVYDEAATLAMLDGAPAAFGGERMRAGLGFGDPSPLPIFVIGMPRSGTTLIEQILASHPAVFAAGETDAFDEALRSLGESGLAALHSPAAAAALPAARLRQLGGAYVAAIRAASPTAERIVNKMPKNFRHAGLIHLALPEARIVHVRRDPFATCLSCFSRQFEDNLPYTYDLGELGRYYRAYQALMAHWRLALPARTLLEVRYEDVGADLEGEARRILAHCGLGWDARCLAFHATQRPVRTASAAQVRQPIDGRSVDRWRGFEPLLAPLRAALGAAF
jgi:tetratricopeptide (TPR) repeat protein